MKANKMKKLVIANIGTANIGKTSSLKRVIDDLLNNGAKEIPGTRLGNNSNGDERVILRYNNITIGIETQGDPCSRIFDSLPYFVKQNCDIIICTCRTTGRTCHEVENLQQYGYDVIYYTHPYTWFDISTKVLNNLYANTVIQMINLRIQEKI